MILLAYPTIECLRMLESVLQPHYLQEISHMTTPLVIAISSRALFDLSQSNHIYQSEGVDAYIKHQIEHENNVLQPGVAFPLVKKLLALNTPEQQLVEIILLSRNSADTGLRIFNSIEHHHLDMTRAAFTNGKNPHQYAKAFGADLFLSADASDVTAAINNDLAAATLIPGKAHEAIEKHTQIRIAFDGDAVLFSEESERIYQEKGLDAFITNEREQAKTPLNAGPFHNFLRKLSSIQHQFTVDECPIITALITARQAPAHERVILTLRSWNIRIDEALFLGGKDKGAFLQAFGADIFFDDHDGHCQSAHANQIAAGHVPSTVR